MCLHITHSADAFFFLLLLHHFSYFVLFASACSCHIDLFCACNLYIEYDAAPQNHSRVHSFRTLRFFIALNVVLCAFQPSGSQRIGSRQSKTNDHDDDYGVYHSSDTTIIIFAIIYATKYAQFVAFIWIFLSILFNARFFFSI